MEDWEKDLEALAAERRKGTVGDSYYGQIMSGLNEGAAEIAGAPVDLANWALRNVGEGVDAVAGSNITPHISSDRPFGGSKWMKDQIGFSIAPPATGTGKRLARSVAREAGASALPAAGLMARGATVAARGTVPRNFVDQAALAAASNPARFMVSEAGAAVGTVAGGEAGRGVGRLVGAPETGEMVGRLVGGVGGGMMTTGPRVPRTGPSEADLWSSADRLYDGIRASGNVIRPHHADMLAGALENWARKDTVGMMLPNGQWRSKIAKDVVNSIRAYGAQHSNAGMSLDAFKAVRSDIDGAIGTAVRTGNNNEARLLRGLRHQVTEMGHLMFPGLQRADATYARAKRHEKLVSTPMAKAETRARDYAQSGPHRSRHNEFRKLTLQADERKLRGVPQSEIDQLYRINRGSPIENAMISAGKMAPTSGIPILTTTGVGSAMGAGAGLLTGSPAVAAGVTGAATTGMMAGGTVARRAAEALQRRRIEQLSELIRTGRISNPSFLKELDKSVVAAMLAKEAREKGEGE